MFIFCLISVSCFSILFIDCFIYFCDWVILKCYYQTRVRDLVWPYDFISKWWNRQIGDGKWLFAFVLYFVFSNRTAYAPELGLADIDKILCHDLNNFISWNNVFNEIYGNLNWIKLSVQAADITAYILDWSAA